MAKGPPTAPVSAKGRAGVSPSKPALQSDISESYAENQAAGGETHQVAKGDTPLLTTSQGAPVADDQNTLRYGARGPALLEDAHFREKIFHFDHERIPERVVHARGYAAHGFFELTDSLADVTRADIFQRVGERTDAFVRFSTVAGNKGSADLARDVRGFAVKLYTREGLLGPRRQQHPGLLHPGRHQVSRHHPCGEARARPRLSASSAEAEALFEKAGLLADLDEGCFPLAKDKNAADFIQACGQLRYWPRELNVDLDAVS